MRFAQIKALIFTILLFGGALWFFLGKPGLSEVNLPKLSKPSIFKNNGRVKTNKAKVTTTTSRLSVGSVIDQYKGVKVYHNGDVTNVSGRNTTSDGYNLGLRYQCVEFAKRFYYEAFGHKMPDSYGHARDFFDGSLQDGQFNKKRGMLQFRNGSMVKPEANDLVVLGPAPYNEYGHLVIVTKSSSSEVEFIQQNPGTGNPSRGVYKLYRQNGKWYINADYIKGWLRLTR